MPSEANTSSLRLETCRKNRKWSVIAELINWGPWKRLMLFEQCNFVTGGPPTTPPPPPPFLRQKPIGASIYDCQQMLAPTLCLWVIWSNFCVEHRGSWRRGGWELSSSVPWWNETRKSAAVQGCNRKWRWNKSSLLMTKPPMFYRRSVSSLWAESGSVKFKPFCILLTSLNWTAGTFACAAFKCLALNTARLRKLQFIHGLHREGHIWSDQ